MIKKLWKFFFKDYIHVFAAAILFTAVLISVFIGIKHIYSIFTWVVAVISLAFARFCDYREEKWLKNALDVTATVHEIKKVHLIVHMTATHYANEDAISPYVIVYNYRLAGKKYQGCSQWFWFKPGFSTGMKIKIKVSISNPQISRLAE